MGSKIEKTARHFYIADEVYAEMATDYNRFVDFVLASPSTLISVSAHRHIVYIPEVPSTNLSKKDK